MFLRIVLSCLYFIPGALLLHGSLWFVTRGKHDFYDVLKVMSLVCLAFVVFVDDEVFNRLLLYPYALTEAFYKYGVSSDFLALMVGGLTLAVEISFAHILPCAWLVKLHGRERLGLKRALYAFLIYCTIAFLIIILCYGISAMVFYVLFYKEEPF
ncbi:MAG TPA: hypothetical protein PKC79_12715 [Solidesulfovibrio magneticus]|nr:hypothetical protein [Solidesulfovibrio magneticus]